MVLGSSADLFGMRIYNFLADVVQLLEVTNKPQVLLLNDLGGCFTWRAPHLLVHLDAQRTPHEAREKWTTHHQLVQTGGRTDLLGN